MVLLDNVSKRYQTRRGEVRALDGVSLKVKQGEFVVVRGPSGCGKSTLLLMIGGMLRPTSGQVTVDGSAIYRVSDQQRARFRAANVGFVFQTFHLVPYLSVIENVLLAAGAGANHADPAAAREILKRLRLSEREHHKPSQLSIGERQRTAVARALLNRPKIVLADEPTGNLDPDNTVEVFGYLAEFHDNGGTVVVVTHGTSADQHADRILHLRQGRIEESSV